MYSPAYSPASSLDLLCDQVSYLQAEMVPTAASAARAILDKNEKATNRVTGLTVFLFIGNVLQLYSRNLKDTPPFNSADVIDNVSKMMTDAAYTLPRIVYEAKPLFLNCDPREVGQVLKEFGHLLKDDHKATTSMPKRIRDYQLRKMEYRLNNIADCVIEDDNPSSEKLRSLIPGLANAVRRKLDLASP